MSRVDYNSSLKPLADTDGDPVFDEAWQAEALAIADALVRNGMFSAAAWSEALGETLGVAQEEQRPDNQETYYECVLETLEKLIEKHSEIDQQAMKNTRELWEKAYLATPHGQPVSLDDS
ncbi:MAG: nitrile hydratase accessory protein [Pseudomonadota bacterium]